jgi:hypothetical protein
MQQAFMSPLCQIYAAGYTCIREPGVTTDSSPDRIARQAAQREACPAKWERRFARLLENGILRLPKNPAAETALHIRQVPFANDVSHIVSFCAEHLLIANRSNCQLSIDLSNVRPKNFNHWLKKFQAELAIALAGVEQSSGALMFSMLDTHPAIKEFLRLRRSTALGYPSLAIRYTGGLDRCEHNWQALVSASHADCRIKLVPVMAVTPLSGLHMLERGDCVMPASLFEIGADTAWLMLEVDATRLGSPQKMKAQLADCLRFADNLIDQISWPRSSLQLDALLNRRVGMHISHLGDLLCRQKMHPASVDTFRWIKRWLWFVRRCFVHESMLLARRRGPFPELGATELIAELTPRYGVCDARRLVLNRSLRHRHILALSPCALFPAESAYADEHWLNLIPALKCADAITMFGPDPRGRLSLQAWQRLLQLTGALGTRDAVISR